MPFRDSKGRFIKGHPVLSTTFHKGHIIRNTGKTRFRKGHISWLRGTKGLVKPNKGSFKKGETLGEKNSRWKGDSVGIEALHSWVKRRVGTPNLCSKCGTTESKKYEWANISHEYKRDLSDWIRLCTKCHQEMDGHGIANKNKNNKFYFNRWSKKWEIKKYVTYQII